ncbi:MAG TPA: hypothetical protein VF192_01300 [Longimicrobiales bacterium]
MDTPTIAEVRGRSELLKARYPEGDAEKEEELQRLLTDLAPIISQLTGRKIGPADTPGVEVPDWLKPVAVRVFTLRAERDATGLSSAARTQAHGSLRLRSFSAGPYSETYFGPGEAESAGVLDPDPLIHEALWALATEDMRNYWLRLWGKLEPEPFAGVRPVNWAGGHHSRLPDRPDPRPLGGYR